jgi:hypothetical protein
MEADEFVDVAIHYGLYSDAVVHKCGLYFLSLPMTMAPCRPNISILPSVEK